MVHLELIEVSKQYAGVHAVDGVSLAISQGECLALLGPSGCGKTTTLNLIAGFLYPDAGTIRIAARDVSSLAAHRRNTGMVFQNYALFTHLTIFENVAFGLRMRRVEAHELERRVEAALRSVRLQGLGSRYPRQLSGGQQQRVALARALVIRPDILLLDEPLSNLDAKLRQEMRVELVEILGQAGITTIFVTHDQEEALALSSRVAIMNRGHVEQVGSPAEVYEEPATGFVAKFLGETNVLAGRVAAVEADGILCDLDVGIRVRSDRKASLSVGESVEVILRAERLRVGRTTAECANRFPTQLEHVLYVGSAIRYILRLGSQRLVAVEQNIGGEDLPRAGAALTVEWPARETLIAPLA